MNLNGYINETTSKYILYILVITVDASLVHVHALY